MATFPISPSLPAVIKSTECDPDFFNTFVDNINAMGDALIALIGGTADGNMDIAADKGILWGTALKIYFSGGDIIIDDGVVISGGLDVGGTFTVDTVTDSGAGFVTFQEDIILAAGKYIDAPTGKFDTIDDSGAAVITINETLELAAGKAIQTAGPAPVSLASGANVTGNLDVSGTLSVDTINDSGASVISVLEDMVLSAGKYVDAPTGKFDTIDDSGAVYITVNEDMEFAAGKYVDAPTGKFDVIDDSGAAQIIINETLEMGAAKGMQGTGASALAINAGMNVTGNLDVSGTLSVDTIDDSGAGLITFSDELHMAAGQPITGTGILTLDDAVDITGTLTVNVIDDSGDGIITLNDDVHIVGVLTVNEINDWGTGFINILEDVRIAITKDLSAYLIHVDVIENYTATPIEIRDDVLITGANTLTVGTAPNYTVTNELVDRSYNANTVAIDELADVVGTMINDLISIGLFQ